MKVLLIKASSNYVKESPIMPLGLLSIATHLKQNGHTVQLVDREIESASVKKVILSFSPDIVGISVISSKSIIDAVEIGKTAKKQSIPVVVGGPIASLIPETILKSGFIDYVIKGDGEIALQALIESIVEKMPLCEVDGLSFIENDQIVINKDRAFCDLSELPIIDFTFVDPRNYFSMSVSGKKVLHTYSSKGCICHCAYCYNPSFCKNVWRPRPLEYVIEEIKYLVDNFAPDGISFIDDMLSPNKERLAEFCQKITDSNLGILWGCDMRADFLTKEDLEMMYGAGCRRIFCGIETGSQVMQKKIKKSLDLKKVKETINYCREIGIKTTTSFIVGLPGETEEELKQTVEFAKNLKSDVKLAFSFGPIPQTELYALLVKNKQLNPRQSYKEMGKSVWFDTFGKNYSKVPTKDYKVITSYFYFSIIEKKSLYEKSNKAVVMKRLWTQITNIIKLKKFKALKIVFLSGTEFLEILYYATMYPRILKKYNLK